MGFVAKQAVSALDYDFSGLGIADLDGVKGCSPEPSTDQVRAMQSRIRDLYDIADLDPAAINAYMAAMSEDELRDNAAQVAEIYADLCSQQPSTDQILALPHRVFAAYIGYLSGELNNPTAGSSVTRRSLAPVKTG